MPIFLPWPTQLHNDLEGSEFKLLRILGDPPRTWWHGGCQLLISIVLPNSPPTLLSYITGASCACLWMTQPTWPSFISSPTPPSTVPWPCLGRMDREISLHRPWNWAWVPMGRDFYRSGYPLQNQRVQFAGSSFAVRSIASKGQSMT